MKKMFCLLIALLILLSCTVASADAFTDLFGSFEHIDATLDRTTNDCIVQPKAPALTAYATNGNALLPYFAKNGDILMVSVIMQGSGALNKPCHAMIITDNHKYRLDLKAQLKPSEIGTMDVEGKKYNIFLLPSEAISMCEDIAKSSKVTVRYSKDTTYLDNSDFELNKEAQALFGTVYEAYMKYDKILDNALMDVVMNVTAYSYVEFKKEVNASSIWD